MIGRIVAVLALLEKGAELDGLVGFVVVEGAQVEPDQAEGQPQAEHGQEQPSERGFFHLAGEP